MNKRGHLLPIYVLTGRNEDHEKKISWSCRGGPSGDGRDETTGTGRLSCELAASGVPPP